MRLQALTLLVAIAATPASAQEVALAINLIAGHPMYDEAEQKAGVAMGLSIAPRHDRATSLLTVCEELRAAAGLENERGDDLRLETIFVVPYKGMAVEGYYWPTDGTLDRSALLRGRAVPRDQLDRIIAAAGIPPRVLDEPDVEHEISCETNAPLWHVTWLDLQRVGDEDPDTVIERARRRFLALHQSVLEHDTREQHVETGRRTASGG